MTHDHVVQLAKNVLNGNAGHRESYDVIEDETTLARAVLDLAEDVECLSFGLAEMNDACVLVEKENASLQAAKKLADAYLDWEECAFGRDGAIEVERRPRALAAAREEYCNLIGRELP